MSGLYVHVPFCAERCPYCDFASVTDLSLVDRWLEAVGHEAKASPDTGVFDTLYLGGGTPGILSEQATEKLFSLLKSGFSFSPDAEVTVEMNPECVTEDTVALLCSFGVNRLSIGIQSLNDEELRFLGRRHSARQALQAVVSAQDAGCTNISADLIFGFPGQTVSSWRQTLSQVVQAGVSHISAYQLTVKEGTPFARMRAEGRLAVLSEEEEVEFFTATCDFFREAGWVHYEVSNYARTPESVCRHNLAYWRHLPYLGLGPSAVSFDGRRRWRNAPDVSEYCHLLQEEHSAVVFEEWLDDDQLLTEKVALGLRTAEGIAGDVVPLSGEKQRMLEHLQREGLIRVEGGRIAATEKGFLLADGLPLVLIG